MRVRLTCDICVIVFASLWAKRALRNAWPHITSHIATPKARLIIITLFSIYWNQLVCAYMCVRIRLYQTICTQIATLKRKAVEDQVYLEMWNTAKFQNRLNLMTYCAKWSVSSRSLRWRTLFFFFSSRV